MTITICEAEMATRCNVRILFISQNAARFNVYVMEF